MSTLGDNTRTVDDPKPHPDPDVLKNTILDVWPEADISDDSDRNACFATVGDLGIVLRRYLPRTGEEFICGLGVVSLDGRSAALALSPRYRFPRLAIADAVIGAEEKFKRLSAALPGSEGS